MEFGLFSTEAYLCKHLNLQQRTLWYKRMAFSLLKHFQKPYVHSDARLTGSNDYLKRRHHCDSDSNQFSGLRNIKSLTEGEVQTPFLVRMSSNAALELASSTSSLKPRFGRKSTRYLTPAKRKFATTSD